MRRYTVHGPRQFVVFADYAQHFYSLSLTVRRSMGIYFDIFIISRASPLCKFLCWFDEIMQSSENNAIYPYTTHENELLCRSGWAGDEWRNRNIFSSKLIAGVALCSVRTTHTVVMNYKLLLRHLRFRCFMNGPIAWARVEWLPSTAMNNWKLQFMCSDNSSFVRIHNSRIASLPLSFSFLR